MLQIFKHRCNDIQSLQTCQKHWGVEIDLRSDLHNKNDLHLSHDPWKQGESFKLWLSEFVKLRIQGPIILNTKEDGLESLAVDLLNNAQVTSYLFLDTSLPTFRKWTREKSQRHFFIRYSSIEPVEMALANKDFCDWTWVDCFDRIPPDLDMIMKLNHYFKTCLVSPELQGGNETELRHFIKLFKKNISGVCTKFPEIWEKECLA